MIDSTAIQERKLPGLKKPSFLSDLSKRLTGVSKRRGSAELVAMVIIICVAIGLCTVFRTQIYNLFVNTIFPALNTAASNFLNFSGSSSS